MSQGSKGIFLGSLFALMGCSQSRLREQADVGEFLEGYSRRYVALLTAQREADWQSRTHIVEGDTSNQTRLQAAEEALSLFLGDSHILETTRDLLKNREQLTELQIRQLERILYEGGESPQAAPELVRRRIAAEGELGERLNSFRYKIEDKEVTANEIDRILRTETDLQKRLQAWEASKQVGFQLRKGLETLRDLRNEIVRTVGYPDFMAYKVAEYGLSSEEMLALTRQINHEIRPLYREIHTYYRYELARKFQQPVPRLIPAHWLPNRWGQDWSALASDQGVNLDELLRSKSAEWITRTAEDFYVSLGFEPLPATFWERSSLYPLPQNAGYTKNSHASAWHMDRHRDVRSLMSIEPTARWYVTAHHELGHIYYYLAYSRPEIPPILRRGANRAYHEAIGELIGKLAATQPRYLSHLDILPKGAQTDPIQHLLQEALRIIAYLPFAAGTMTEFEHDLYARNLPPPQWNARWWELAETYQGICAPSQRDERSCDAATKSHIIDDPAEYYDYTLATVLAMQFHHHIATKILREDPHDTNYYGKREVGDFLRAIMQPGASTPWQSALRTQTGEDLSAKPLLAYFQPLLEWLEVQNHGRVSTLPEIP